MKDTIFDGCPARADVASVMVVLVVNADACGFESELREPYLVGVSMMF